MKNREHINPENRSLVINELFYKFLLMPPQHNYLLRRSIVGFLIERGYLIFFLQ